MRLDKYLKVSRIIKRRTVASEAASLGRIQINGKVAKPSSEVKEGDMLDTVVKVTSVQEFTTKAAAAEMYEMITRGDLE